MKATFIKARGQFKPGDVSEFPEKEYSALEDSGFVVSPREYALIQTRKEEGKQSIVRAVQACKESGAIAPKDEAVLTASLARYDAATLAGGAEHLVFLAPYRLAAHTLDGVEVVLRGGELANQFVLVRFQGGNLHAGVGQRFG